MFSFHKLSKNQVSISSRVFRDDFQRNTIKYHRIILLEICLLLAYIAQLLKRQQPVSELTDELRQADQIPTPISTQVVRCEVAMQGGSDRLLGRRFSVVNVNLVERKAIQANEKGILRFCDGGSHQFIYGGILSERKGNQDKLGQNGTYVLRRGAWDSIVTNRRVVRLIGFERVNK